MKPASLLLALFTSTTINAAAASGDTAEEIGARFASVAGSVDNAVKLARALHAGKVAALRSVDANGNPTLVAFGVPEGGMSWSEVQDTLAKAQSTLSKSGVVEGGAQQVQAALIGGHVKRHDGTDVSVDGALATRAAARAFEAPSSDGLPVYGATVALPNASPSTWGSYRPSARPSKQIEHLAGVVNAGYLR